MLSFSSCPHTLPLSRSVAVKDSTGIPGPPTLVAFGVCVDGKKTRLLTLKNVSSTNKQPFAFFPVGLGYHFPAAFCNILKGNFV